MQTITSDLVTVALERVAGKHFEEFVNAFYPAISGASYVPLGGLHDGGADGFFDSGLSEVRGKQGAFLQASIQEDHRVKIRETVKRLRKFGRTPTSLTYVTSRVIQHVDRKRKRSRKNWASMSASVTGSISRRTSRRATLRPTRSISTCVRTSRRSARRETSP